MKVREDFVTNSSSSSFVINRNDVTHDKLLEILLEIANKENYGMGEELYTFEEDVVGNCVAYRYNVREATQNDPYEDWDGFIYDNNYIVDNNSCGRYDWDIVKEVMDKYNIPFEYGYCD